MTADITTAEFVKSSSTITQCPEPDLPEYAFIGRSNVGKSSLINMLTAKKKLAKISGTPGKTQLVNHFKINEASKNLGCWQTCLGMGTRRCLRRIEPLLTQ